MVMGVFRLIFNFYALSLGFDEALLGNLITTSSFVALIAALPMGYLADVIGRKASLIFQARCWLLHPRHGALADGDLALQHERRLRDRAEFGGV
jgi:predicted MFS family arabinose efflux permease